MLIRHRYKLPLALVLVVALVLTMSLAVGAAPPGSERSSQTWGGGDAGDIYYIGNPDGLDTFASIGFSTDDQGDNMWVNLDLRADATGYHCWWSGRASSWTDDKELQYLIVEVEGDGVDMEGGEPGDGGTCGDGLLYASIFVDYSGADTSKWHTNRTGSQCRGNDVTHNDASGSVVIVTVDDGRFGMDGDNKFFWPNYYSSDWRCHSTGTPGKP